MKKDREFAEGLDIPVLVVDQRGLSEEVIDDTGIHWDGDIGNLYDSDEIATLLDAMGEREAASLVRDEGGDVLGADDPRVGSNPFSVPSRNPPEIDGVEYGYAGIREGFKITGPYGETAIGYAYNADFPNDIGSPSRGELFLVNVPEEVRRKGAGKAISIEALKLMTSHGAETVVMHATSVGGQRIIDSLIMDGYISEPIRASSTGKKEYRIHNDGVWDADEHGLHTGARP
jgi:hypothetical protein